MGNRIGVVLNDLRSDVRVSDRTDVMWNKAGSEGKGLIRNISISGMLLETKSSQEASQDEILNFRAKEGDNGFLPSNGRVMWSQSKGKNKNMLGVKFENPSEDVLTQLRQRVQIGIKRDHKAQQWLVILNVILAVSLIALVVYSVWTSGSIYSALNQSNDNLFVAIDGQTKLTQTYTQLYKDTKQELEVVTKELVVTQGALTETQTLLAQAQDQLSKEKGANVQLQEQLSLMTEQNTKLTEEFNRVIASLNEKNTRLEQEVETLSAKIRYYEGEISSSPEGKELIRLYKDRMKLVRSKIHKFQKEAAEIQKQALKERDQARMVLGNNGFFVKNGIAVRVDDLKYQNADAVGVQTVDQQKVNIDVQMVK